MKNSAPLCSTCCKGEGPHVPVRTKLVATSAKDLVESLALNAERLAWCEANHPRIDARRELDEFKIDMRACGYRLSSGRGGLVKDAWAAFQRRMRTAELFAIRSGKPALPQRTVRTVAKKEE